MEQQEVIVPSRSSSRYRIKSFSPFPSGFGSALVFFREFLRAPAMIGSVIPTSTAAVRAMLEPLDWQNTKLFVEYGPGLGTFTHDILARLPEDARLIAIDTNGRFVTHLRSTIQDPRFRAAHGSAADVTRIIGEHGHDKADYILSGLPFSTLPAGVAPAIIEATHTALRVGGAFLVYQYSRFVLPMLQPYFPDIDQQMLWRNIPPVRTFSAWRSAPEE
ncbi:MAG: methyltransferase [Sphingobium sp.]